MKGPSAAERISVVRATAESRLPTDRTLRGTKGMIKLISVMRTPNLPVQERRKADTTCFMSVGILNIASTCTLWRAVSMIRPSLWSDITILLDSLCDRVSGYDLVEVLKSWLRYSGTSPLTLRLHIYGPLLGFDGTLPVASNFHCGAERVLHVLLLESCRWESAVISMDASSVMHMCDSLGAVPVFPKLQKLTLSLDPNDGDMTSSWPRYWGGFFFSAPLRQLALPNDEFWQEDFSSPSGWTSLASLTSLTFDIFYDESIPLLEHFPLLEHLRILRYKGRSFGLADSVIVRMERLSHLDICIGVPDHEPEVLEPDIFAFLEAPRLASLDISKHSYEYYEYEEALVTKNVGSVSILSPFALDQ
ncbi:hypothetical protein K435DRAFT_812879 [Dendrothele bispora CBS 962.96]|uniref:F-box domain-containing protein n=1 Tax=Dendrothele bispora (strain CBS 962.96) TaxID=1314807 RepID=A0A4S8KN01_DENBC|nr:hypothetical protein K435DRAFT_812879 [Dendrothele bispora CBS 962.96]